jgi:uncharacterized protein with FMN-binding domain
MSKRMKIMVLLACSIPVLLLFTGCAALAEMNEFAENGVIYSPDLKAIADGEYIGEYKCGFVRAKVNIVIRNHSIVSFAILEHDNGRGAEAEQIADRVVQAQSLEVDAVSGATISSKVILKAGEKALSSKTDAEGEH